MSVVIAFAVMASINFVFAAIQPWLVLLCVSSIIVAGDTNVRKDICGFHSRILVLFFVTTGVLILSVIQVQMVYSQWRLHYIQNKGREERHLIYMKELEALSTIVYTSEAYWTFLAKEYYSMEQYKESVSCLKQAMRYTSIPAIYYSAFFCYEKMKEPGRGIPYLVTIRNMLPQNLNSRLLLLNCYDTIRDEEMAKSMAEEIDDIPVKIKNKQATIIQKRAKEYLKNHKTDK
jgi:tetratricopeptide (TPR) repeat protein